VNRKSPQLVGSGPSPRPGPCSTSGPQAARTTRVSPSPEGLHGKCPFNPSSMCSKYPRGLQSQTLGHGKQQEERTRVAEYRCGPPTTLSPESPPSRGHHPAGLPEEGPRCSSQTHQRGAVGNEDWHQREDTTIGIGRTARTMCCVLHRSKSSTKEAHTALAVMDATTIRRVPPITISMKKKNIAAHSLISRYRTCVEAQWNLV
jgi:hypothetical protein